MGLEQRWRRCELHFRKADVATGKELEGGKAGGRQADTEDIPTLSQGLLPHKAPLREISVLESGKVRLSQRAKK